MESIKNIVENPSSRQGVGKRLTIAGETRVYTTYYIPIEFLYYNDLNGRIAVYEQEYASNQNNTPLPELRRTDLAEYNKIIGKFIKDSATDNGKSYKHTKEDIKNNLQKVPGVILDDGRIIDGNRRFTAIRELHDEVPNPAFGYFECVVLEAPQSDNKDAWKEIVSLEINLQFNEDEKRDYDPIDKYASFYNNCIDTETSVFTKKEYVHTSGISDSEYDNMERIVRIMVDYLEWRNQPRAFYLLKNEKLDGPIEDIAGKARKDLNSFFESDLRNDVYTYITLIPQGNGDRTRKIRALMSSANNSSALYDTYKSTLTSDPNTNILLGRALSEKDKKYDDNPDADKNKRNLLREAQVAIERAYDKGELNEKAEKDASEPAKILEKATDLLKTIKIEDVKKSPEPRRDKFFDELGKLKQAIKEIEDGTNKDS